MKTSQQITDFIYSMKFSTTEIADALGKTGAIPLLAPAVKGSYVVGSARCLFTANGSNFDLHSQLDNIQKHEVALIFTQYCVGKAILGDIMAKYMLDVRKARGIVVQGLMRDISEIRARNYPLWCSGFSPIGCVNKQTTPFAYEDRTALEQRYNESILICDDCGVVAITKEYQNKFMLERLKGMRLQEEVWNYCIDELGWNTERTICDKDYLKDPEILPPKYRDQIELLSINFGAPPTKIVI